MRDGRMHQTTVRFGPDLRAAIEADYEQALVRSGAVTAESQVVLRRAREVMVRAEDLRRHRREKES